MGMSHIYTGHKQPDGDSIAVIHRALDLGVTLIDTAEIYGPEKNEVLVGKAIKGRRDKVVLATKFGLRSNVGRPAPDSSLENIRVSIENSLKRLDVDYIDLYYQHRVDKTIPIEDVMGTLVDLIDEGKIGHIGLSEAGQATIRRAHAVHPVTALLSNPRFVEDVFDENLRRVQEIVAVAAEVGATPAQVSLAWLLAKGADWVPIPGTIRVPHLQEDLGAVDVSLTAEQMTRLDNITQPLGDHHSPAQMAMFDR
jgi:aryl-alcohol dehydrogenase-like predicted oxidoreductase